LVLTLYVGLFYIINITTGLSLLPSRFFDRYKWFALSNLHKLKRNSNRFVAYVSSAFAAFCLIICLIVNLSYMHWYSYELNKPFNTVVNVLRLNQYWACSPLTL